MKNIGINAKIASHMFSLVASVEGTTVCLEIPLLSPPPPRVRHLVTVTPAPTAVSINHTVLNRPSWHLLNNSMGQTAETLHMQHPTNLINPKLLGVTRCGVALPTVPAAGACYPSHSTSHAALPSIFCFTNLNAINHSTLSEECSQVMQCNGMAVQGP